MKKIVGIVILILSINCASQKENLTDSKKIEMHKLSEEYSFKIKEILSDSRCPEGVNCIWAGEVSLTLSIYKEDDFFKEEAIVVSYKNLSENKDLLEKYTSGKKIDTIEINPTKKVGVKIAINEYVLKITFKDN
jgi:hypothetical protein